MRGAELEDEVQDVEEFGRGLLLLRGERLREFNLRRGRGRRLSEELRKGLHLITRLDLLHVVEVIWFEELGAIYGQGQLSFRLDQLFDALGLRALPARAGD